MTKITIRIAGPPGLEIAVGLPPKELAPNAGRGMPRSPGAARKRIGGINAAAQRYKAEAWASTLRALAGSPTPELSDVVLLLTFFWPSARSKAGRDGDNASASFKAAQDGIARALEINDKRIVQLPPVFLVDERRPRVEVGIYYSRIDWELDR